jgi:hypothetical protein
VGDRHIIALMNKLSLILRRGYLDLRVWSKIKLGYHLGESDIIIIIIIICYLERNT